MALRISAIGWRDHQIVIVIDVAGSAGHVGVAIGQREVRELQMIEAGVEPRVQRRVARFAIGREFCRDVIRIGGFPEIPQMARRTSRRESGKLPHRRILVALGALHRGMGAQQRKPVEVILHCFHRNVPAQRSVALGAVGAKLALVNVSVAIGAILAHVGEDGLHVAVDAIHFFVHPAQWVTRGVVIKFRDGANRGPARGGMAVFAGNR